MKKLTLVCTVLAAVAGSGLSSGSVQACDHYRRVVYSHPSRVVYSTPVVRSTSVIQSAPVVHSTTLVSKPVVTTTVTQQQVLEVIEKLPEIQQGSVIRAKVRFAGQEAGEVTIQAGSLEMQCEVLEWTSGLVTFRLPAVEIVSGAEITLKIFAANGDAVRSVKGILTPPADFQIEPPTATLVQGSSPEASIR